MSTATDPLIVDVDVRDHDWTVTVRLGDNVPEQLAADIVAELHAIGHYQAQIADALRAAVIKLDPIEACDAGETLTRAGSHPGDCTAVGEDGRSCRRVAFNTGLCRVHFGQQQDAVDARLAAQGFATGRTA